MKKILAFVLSIMMLISFVGCSATTPQKTVENFFADAKAFNIDTMKERHENIYTQLMAANEDLGITEEEMSELYKSMLAELKLEEVNISNENEETATVSVKITGADLSEVMVTYMNEYLTMALSSKEISEEEFNTYMADFFKETVTAELGELKTTTYEYDITLKNVDGKWNIESNDDLINSLQGGMFAGGEEGDDSEDLEEAPEESKL